MRCYLDCPHSTIEIDRLGSPKTQHCFYKFCISHRIISFSMSICIDGFTGEIGLKLWRFQCLQFRWDILVNIHLVFRAIPWEYVHLNSEDSMLAWLNLILCKLIDYRANLMWLRRWRSHKFNRLNHGWNDFDVVGCAERAIDFYRFEFYFRNIYLLERNADMDDGLCWAVLLFLENVHPHRAQIDPVRLLRFILQHSLTKVLNWHSIWS